MKAIHFRAYGKGETISRRDTPQGKKNLLHDVHDVIEEGALKDGVASFKGDPAYVVFYSGKGDEQTVAGRLDGPFKGGKADFADVPQEAEAAPGEVVVDGQRYREA